MKNQTVTLDRVLYRILKEEEIKCFTIMDLRDMYLQHINPNGLTAPKLRLYLYDQIRKIVGTGWVTYHDTRKARGQMFEVNSFPEGLNIRQVAPSRGILEAVKSSPRLNDAQPRQPKELLSTPLDIVEEMLRSTRLDFLTALGETERYQKIIEDVPSLRHSLEPCMTAARDNSSKLLGHISALETALNKLGQQQ